MKLLDAMPNSSGCIAECGSVPATPVIGRFLARVENLYQAWRQRQSRQKDLDHIAKFSPYLLRDIGLNPEDIASAKPKKHFASTNTVGRPG